MLPLIKEAYRAIKNAGSNKRHAVSTANIVLTLAITTMTAIAGGVQAIAAATQSSPLPRIEVRSIAELRVYIEERRKDLQSELQNVEALLRDIDRADAASRSSNPSDGALTSDPVWLTAVKIFPVYLTIAFSVLLTPIALLFDLIALAFGKDFLFIKGLWSFSWSQVTLGWYWSPGKPAGIALSFTALVLFSGAISLFDASSRRPASGATADGDA